MLGIIEASTTLRWLVIIDSHGVGLGSHLRPSKVICSVCICTDPCIYLIICLNVVPWKKKVRKMNGRGYMVANIVFTSHQEEFLHFQCQKVVFPTWLKLFAMEWIKCFLSKDLPCQSDNIPKLSMVLISGQIIGLDGRMLLWIDWLQPDMARTCSTQWTNMNLTVRHEKHFINFVHQELGHSKSHKTANLGFVSDLCHEEQWRTFQLPQLIWVWKTQPLLSQTSFSSSWLTKPTEIFSIGE